MRRIAVLLLLLGSFSPLPADVELLLRDGQKLAGVDVRRVGEHYLLELESGDVLSLPIDLVRSVRLTGDDTEPPSGLADVDPAELGREPSGPTGIRRGEPQVLAGVPVRPPRTAEQLEVFGEPSRFQKSPVKSSWRPRSAFEQGNDVLERGRSEWQEDIIDPEWTPHSAFDPAKDALKPSRSRWQESIIDPSWRPSDGFKERKTSMRAGAPSRAGEPLADVALSAAEREPAGRGRLWRSILDECEWCDGRASTARTARMQPRDCAERIFAAWGDDKSPASVEVSALDDEPFARLPVPLHRAALTAEPFYRAVFTVAGNRCRLIGGDLQALLGSDLDEKHAAGYAETAYDRAVEGVRAPRLAGDRGKVWYAYAVSVLLDAEATGRENASLLLLSDAGDLDRVLSDEGDGCQTGARKRRRALKAAERSFRPPEVAPGAQGDVVTFYTWSSAAGAVRRHVVYLSPDGSVSSGREEIASHVGAHRDVTPAR